MSFVNSIQTCLAKYFDFTGRAGRPEFWYFVLFVCIVQAIIVIVFNSSQQAINVLSGVADLAFLFPLLAAGARRLHDTDRSGWWQLIQAIPLIGIIVLIYFFCLRGDAGPNRFGPA